MGTALPTFGGAGAFAALGAAGAFADLAALAGGLFFAAGAFLAGADLGLAGAGFFAVGFFVAEALAFFMSGFWFYNPALAAFRMSGSSEHTMGNFCSLFPKLAESRAH